MESWGMHAWKAPAFRGAIYRRFESDGVSREGFCIGKAACIIQSKDMKALVVVTLRNEMIWPKLDLHMFIRLDLQHGTFSRRFKEYPSKRAYAISYGSVQTI